jgi:hypothetical protein
MHQRLEDRLAGDALQIPTRDRKPGRFQQGIPESEAPSHQVVQWYAGNGDVSPMFGGRQRDAIVPPQRLQRLDLEEGYLPTLLRLCRIIAGAE